MKLPCSQSSSMRPTGSCRRWAALAVLAVVWTFAACTTPEDEDLHDDDLKISVPWHDVMGQRGKPKPSDPLLHLPPTGQSFVAFGQHAAAPPATVGDEAQHAAALAHAKTPRPMPHLAARPVPLALASLTKKAAYEGGTYGELGTAKVFLAPTRTVQDFSHLYWVMVKVLSEKYSCFLTGKESSDKQVLVHCRDGRRVLFWRERGDDWIQFQARQYDRDGYEIIVRNHQIIRLGSQDGVPFSRAVKLAALAPARP